MAKACAFKVLTKTEFYRLVSASTLNSDLYSISDVGIIGQCDGFLVCIFSNLHYSIILIKGGCIWIDQDELKYLSALGAQVNHLNGHIFANFSAIRFSYDKVPLLYLSSGLSRGTLFFHYGHYLTDFIPALYSCRHRFSSSLPVLSPLPQSYTEPLLSLCDLQDSCSIDSRLIRDVTEAFQEGGSSSAVYYINVPLYLHDPFPQFDYHSKRGINLRYMLQRCSGRNDLVLSGVNQQNESTIIYLYRTPSRYAARVLNQSEILAYICSRGGMCLDPSDITVSQLLSVLARCTHCLVEAGSAAYLPLMFPCKAKIAMIVPAGKSFDSYLLLPDEIRDFAIFRERFEIIPAFITNHSISQAEWNSPGIVNLLHIESFLAVA